MSDNFSSHMGNTLPWSFLALEDQNLESSSIVVLPVPYDSTTSYRSGTNEGPKAIIDASRYLEDYDIELKCEPSSLGILTLPELEPNVDGPKAMINRVKDVVKYFSSLGKIVALFGGEHCISLGAVQAMSETYNDLSVLYLDAHGDLREEYMGSKYSHACTARRILEICPIVEVGVRSISKEEADFIDDQANGSGINLYFYDLGETSRSWDVEEIVSKLSSNVYLSIDLDVLDPSFMAAVGTPEPGGLGWERVLDLIRCLCENKNLVGFDIVELSPSAGPPSCAFIASKLAYKTMGYALS